MAFPNDAIANDFILFPDTPRRGYPGIPIRNRFSYYEKENRPVTPSLEGAPDGMTVSSNGTITWENPVAGSYTITLKLTRTERDLVEYPSAVLQLTQVFVLVVSTAKHIFVATSGSDTTGDGSITAPYRTIAKAESVVLTGTGATIILRGGTYSENWNGSSNGMGYGKTWTDADPLEIMARDGEAVIVDSAGQAGLYMGAGCAGRVIIRNITCRNSTGPERGNFVILSANTILKDCISYGANWTGDGNTTGIICNNDGVVINRCFSYSNRGTTGNTNNMSNFLIYNKTAGATMWLMNCKGWDSNHNFKIKHHDQNTAKTIFHNIESVGCGFTGAGLNNSVRYCVFWRTATGISQSLTDPGDGSITSGKMLFENNTIISVVSAAECFAIGGNVYGQSGDVLRRNIFFQDQGAPGGGNDQRKFFQLWQGQTTLATVQALTFDSDYNNFYNPAGDASGFIVGSNGIYPTPYSFAEYKALPGGAGIVRDPHGFLDAPGFADISTGNLNVGVTAPVATKAGTGKYAGAFRPGQTYRNVGQQDTVLISWDGNNPTPPPGAPGTHLSAARPRGSQGKGRRT